MTSARFSSSVCSSRIASAATTLRPASIIVANCREKTCSDLRLDALVRARLHGRRRPRRSLVEALGEKALAVRSCSRAASASGAASIAVQDRALGVDRAVGERRQRVSVSAGAHGPCAPAVVVVPLSCRSEPSAAAASTSVRVPAAARARLDEELVEVCASPSASTPSAWSSTSRSAR